MKQLVQNKFCNVSNLINPSLRKRLGFTPQESGQMQPAAETRSQMILVIASMAHGHAINEDWSVRTPVVLVPALVFAASPTEVAPAVCMPQTMPPPVVDQHDPIFRKAIVDTDRSKVVHRHEWNRRDAGSAAGKSGETGNKAKPDSCLHDLLRKKERGTEHRVT
jgi:hypothetical protein